MIKIQKAIKYNQTTLKLLLSLNSYNINLFVLYVEKSLFE